MNFRTGARFNMRGIDDSLHPRRNLAGYARAASSGWRVILLCFSMSVRLAAAVLGMADPTFARPEFKASAFPSQVISDGRGGLIWTFANVNLLADADGHRSGGVIRTLESGAVDTGFATGPGLRDAVACVAQPNGKLLVSAASLGDINSNGIPNYHVVRLLTNGLVDSTYASPIFDGPSRFMTLQPDGKLIVGGLTWVPAGNGGITNTVRLNPDGSLDGTFHSSILLSPPGNGGVYAPLVLLTNGQVYLAGGFTNVDGEARLGVARLQPNGDLDNSFVPSGFIFSLFVRGVVVQGDGKVVIAGRFRRTGDPKDYCLLRLNADGSIDPSFSLVTINSIGMSRVRFLRADDSGRLLAIGNTLARFNPDGSPDDSFNRFLFGDNFFGGTVACTWFELLRNGKVVIPISTVLQLATNRMDLPFVVGPDGTLDPTFLPPLFQTESYPTGLRVQEDNKLLVWGRFDRMGTNVAKGLARLNVDGSLDSGFTFNAFSNVTAVGPAVIQTNNGLFAVVSLGNSPDVDITNTLVHVLPGGTLDTNFVSAVDLSFLVDPQLFLQGNQPIVSWNTEQHVIYGYFTVARFQMDGSFDPSFTGITNALGVVQRDGAGNIVQVTKGGMQILTGLAVDKMLAVITTNAVDFRVVRLNADGTLDSEFNGPMIAGLPPVSSIGLALVYDPLLGLTYQVPSVHSARSPVSTAQQLEDGSVLIGGSFRQIGGYNIAGLARLTTTGLVDLSFPVGNGPTLSQHPERVARIDSIHVDTSGKIWITGNFDRFNGNAARGVVRLNNDGTVDTMMVSQARFYEYELFDGLSSGTQWGTNDSVYLSGTFALDNDSWPFAVTRLVKYTPPRLLDARYLFGIGFTFDAELIDGQSYRVQISSNLLDWGDLTNVMGRSTPVVFTDPQSQFVGRRFYRLVTP